MKSRNPDLSVTCLGEARGLSQAAHIYVNNKETGVEVSLLSYAYVRCVALHLRREDQDMYQEALQHILSEAQIEELLRSPHRPHHVSEMLTVALTDSFNRGEIKGIRALVAAHDCVQRLNKTFENIERIATTAEPWSYQKHMRFTTQLWLGILPLALLPTLQLATPIMAPAIGYVLLKMDDVSMELQNPFGMDKSDLDICVLTDRFQSTLEAQLLMYVRQRQPTEVVPQKTIDDKADKNGLAHSF